MGWFDSIGGFFSSVASAISSAVSSAFGGGSGGSGSNSGGSGSSSSGGSSSGGFGGGGGGGLGLDGGLANAAAGGGYVGGSSGPGSSSSGSSSSSSSGTSGGSKGSGGNSGGSGGGFSGGGLGGDHSSSWGGISSGDHTSLNLDGGLHNAAHGGGYSYSATHHDSTPKRTPKPASRSSLDLDGALHNAAHGGLLEKATTQKQIKVKSTKPSLNLDGGLHNAAHGGGYSYKPSKNNTNIEIDAKPKIDINKPDTVFDTTLNLDEHAAKLQNMVSDQIGTLKSFDKKLGSIKNTARHYEKTQYMLDPITGTTTGFIAGLGLGAAEFFGGLGALGEQAIVNPASLPSTLKDSIVGTGKQVIEAAKALPEDTIPAGEVVGQLLTGAALEGGLEYAGVKTPGSILHDTISGPIGKLNTLFDPLRRGYKPELSEEINFVPAPTYEPRPVEHYIDRFAGKENTLIHMTSSSVFAKAREGEEILLKGNPEAASGFRKEFDLLHWYQSLPTDEGRPNAYLAYVGIGQKESEKAEFRLRPSRKVGIVTRDVVNYIPPKEGETLAEYSKRVGKLSGVTQIPAENVFDKSVERQVITPAAFEGNLDEYPGTKLKKVSDIGWTRYQENRLPEELKNTKVGEFLEKIGIGQKYHKIEFSSWEKIPVEDTDLDVKPVEGEEKEIKHLNLEEYNEEYLTPKREVTLSDSISKATEELSLIGKIKPSKHSSGRKTSSGSSGIMELSSGYEGIKQSKSSSGRKTSSGINSWWDRWNKWEKLWSSGESSTDFSGSHNSPGKSSCKPSKRGQSVYPSNAGSGGQSNYPSTPPAGTPPAGNSGSGSSENPEKMVSVKYKPIGFQAKTNKRKIKGKLFDLKDWKLNPDITPLADWWAMTYTQAFLGLKARSPYRFDAKKRWKAELTDYGFGLTFPTKFLEERRVKTYLDVTIKKDGEIDIVTGKRAKRKIKRAKSLKLVGKDFVNVGFGSGKQADVIFNEKLKKLKI